MTKLTLVIGNKNYSSWSLRAWLAMKQAGLEFAEVRIPLDWPTTHEEIRRYSPSGKVPVLIDGELKVWESLAICEYVAERFANDLWPADVAERAIARSICAEMHAGFQNLRENMPMDCRNRYPGEGMTPGVEEKSIASLPFGANAAKNSEQAAICCSENSQLLTLCLPPLSCVLSPTKSN